MSLEPKVCGTSGCTRLHKCRGLCATCYARWRRRRDGYDPELPRGPLARYVATRVSELNPHDCRTDWPSARGLKVGGRPTVTIGRRNIPAVRYAWHLAHHRAWPDGQLNHTCHDARCWNHFHTYVGTQAENVADMVAAGRLAPPARGEGHYRARMTGEQVRTLRAAYAAGEIPSIAALARSLGLPDSTVRSAIEGDSWAHI